MDFRGKVDVKMYFDLLTQHSTAHLYHPLILQTPAPFPWFRCACRMAALMRATRVPSFLFVLLVFVISFVHVTLSLIQYDRQTLLDIRLSLGKDSFTNLNYTFRITSSDCSGPFVVPPLCLPARRRKKKRGERGAEGSVLLLTFYGPWM